MDANPLISVGITVYRRPGYLLQSAGSVIAQTYQNWELLIGINPADAEAPQLTAAAELLCKFDQRISIVWCSDCNSGFTKAKKLVWHMHGEWWADLDYDDLWYPDRLEKQVPYTDRYDVISAQAIYFGKRDGERVITPAGELAAEYFTLGNPVVSPTVLMRTEFAHRFDPEYEFGPHDYKLWVELVNEGKQFYALPHILALHRLADDSFYNSHMDETLVEKIGLMVKQPYVLAPQ